MPDADCVALANYPSCRAALCMIREVAEALVRGIYAIRAESRAGGG